MATKFRDYYEILGVSRTASDDEIKQAYRRLARQHHPDLHPEKEKDQHTRRMQEINEAYAVLSSKENRAKYDQLGANWQEGAPPPPPRSGASGQFTEQDLGGFSDFFRQMFQQGDVQSDFGDFYPSELDIEAEFDLSLEEALHGVEKSITLMTTGLCTVCHGSGRVKNKICQVCGGVGEVRKPRDIRTNIPAGLTEGSRIRLKGQGNEGPRGRGDLYLRIHLIPDARFKVQGTNLELDLRIRPWQAVLGSEVSVGTLEGPLRVRVPKGTHTGKLLRLAGRGLGKAGARGDLYLRISIDIPDAPSPDAERLYKQLSETEGSHA